MSFLNRIPRSKLTGETYDSYSANAALFITFDSDLTTMYKNENSWHSVANTGCTLDTTNYKMGGGALAYQAGEADYFRVTGWERVGTGAITMEAALRIHDPNASYQFFFDNTGNLRCYIYVSSPSTLYLWNGKFVTLPSAIPMDGSWFHLAIERESDGTSRGYLNGNPSTTTASDSTDYSNTTANFGLGMYGAGAYPCGQQIDNFAIFHSAKYQGASFTPFGA